MLNSNIGIILLFLHPTQSPIFTPANNRVRLSSESPNFFSVKNFSTLQNAFDSKNLLRQVFNVVGICAIL